MDMLEQRIQQQFFDSADLKYAAAEVLSKPIAAGVSALMGAITSGGKVLACGNGGSAAIAQHFVASFVGRFDRERPGLAALALTCDGATLTALGRDYDFDAVFAKQVQALGAPGDILLAVSPAGDCGNVVQAIQAAQAREMVVLALTGHKGGRLREQLTETDVLICVPHERAARIQELHWLTLHCLCDAVDLQLLGEQETT
jgi:D-sedoheptulose 7-phosphate isomerase